MTYEDGVSTQRFLAAGRIETTAADDWRVSLELHGEFDAANTDELKAVLDEHLAVGRRVLRIDFRGVTFMDSTAIGAIVHTHARCTDDHGSLILTGVGPRIARLFEITGLDHVLLIDSARDDDTPVAD
jgi:anti-anti-sigma factor